MNILVTGATGFIGRNLVNRLSGGNDKIFCLVRKTSQLDKIRNKNVEFLVSDIANYTDLENKITKSIDIIVHCAALVESNDIKKLREANVLGTKNICRLGMKLKVKKFIHISSVAVVSGNPQKILTEVLPFKATNNYGQSKIEAEEVVINYKLEGLPAIVIRPPGVYGEDEPHLLSLLLFLLKYRLFPLFGKGESLLHLGYIQNIVDGVVFAIFNEKCLGETFFLADSNALSAKEAFTIMATSIGGKQPFLMPQWITTIFTKLPFLGKKVKSFMRGRIYSQEKIISLGFKHAHNVNLSLAKSARAMRGLPKT